MNLRSAIAPPPNPPSCAHSRYISFLHPAYDEPSNTLLRLYAPDLPGHRGLDFQYALVACGIITGNRWDGWLTLDRSSSEEARVQPNDGILREANYYFHLPHPAAPSAAHDREDNSDTTSSSPPYQYPVVPTFQEWSFPTQLPESWIHLLPPPPPTQTYSQSALSVAVKNRDTFCRISGCRDAVQAAHLCPLSEEQWFRKNNMGRYSSESSARNGINSPANAYLLRADLHYLHDCLYFVFVPKIGLDGTHQMVFHLTEPLDEIESLYHNRKVHRLQVSPEYLFARFARTIFPSIQDFLLAQVPRHIKIGHGTPQMMTPTELERFSVKSSRSRSHSPKKRKISTDPIPPYTEVHGHQRKRMRASPDTKTSYPDIHEAVSPDLPPTTSFANKVTVSPGTSEPATPGSVASLKIQWLAKERDRSGVDGALEAEQEWLEDVYAGKIMVGDEAVRWFEAQGIEIQSDDDCNGEERIPKESDVT